MQLARDALVAGVRAMDDAGLAAARRGSWSVRETLRHVLDSDAAYAKVVGYLRSSTVDAAATDDIATVASAAAALEAAHRVLVGAIEGVDEATFYDLKAVGREQYSVLSVMENAAAHDREHLEQIERTLGAAGKH
jgi:hypothetical protein